MRCDECNIDVIVKNEELECPKCGLICGQVLEANVFERETLMRHKDVVLGSVIGREKGASKLRRLARIHNIAPKERATHKGIQYCNMVANEFRMSSSAKEEFKRLYTKLKVKGIFHSKMSLENRAASIGYIVLRLYGFSYTLQEVSKILEFPAKKISKLARIFARELGLSHVFSTVNVNSLIEKFCMKMGKSRKFITQCISFNEYLQGLDSKHPTTSYLAGVIYFVETTQLEKTTTQKRIAEVMGITVVTLRLHNKDILTKLNIKNNYGLTIEDIISGVR
jgi:transcription initiation factor TFIIIB Brf1 subunit/transcription initiation factor TFIIB